MPGHTGTTNPGPNGNHNGGVIRFGPDGKLYIFMGDQGRRGWLQNLANGPFETAPFVDDTFGGPAPDNAHLSGVILRLNDDGSTPADNPFFAAGAAMGGEVGANIQKVFSYGHRNGFGMAFDPVLAATSGRPRTATTRSASSTASRPGMNGGWIQIGGPAAPLLRLQGHRGQRVRRRAAAGALPADPAGRVARRGPRAAVHAARARSTSIPN